MNLKNDDKQIAFELIINAPVEEVYKAWSTKEGIRTFFAPGVGNIDIKLFGDYHIYFFPDNPADQRGVRRLAR